ncbi:class III extradiol dioxygenase subunit B-like domain-containing protein [Nocardia sp. XZ_19_385]|uniref:class III extradiol dioxygenase subunit B-like domain-containing protein n=1 Tax=Nocardia sp. XZ_19_385 TaxID=2769488 RepID=UPI0018907101|nr:class III extradiol dioxygenase subunit B-like domain-containing protein [Nocardia sp. XZ_19_385]
MFSLAALVPSPPILVPELGGAVARTDADPVAPLREAALEAVRALDAAGEWVVVGIGDTAGSIGPGGGVGTFRGIGDTAGSIGPRDGVGTFRGFGADVRVAMSEAALLGQGDALTITGSRPSAAPDPAWPLSALIAAWLRGQAAPEAQGTAWFVEADRSAADCVQFGASLRASFDRDQTPVGVLVIADGSSKLTTKSPGYLNPQAAAVQEDLEKALAAGDVAALLALDPELCEEVGISGRAAYQVLAGLFAEDPAAPTSETLYQDAPFGVGYHVGLWQPGGAS